MAPSGIGQTVKITAANAQSVTRDVLILEKFPFTRKLKKAPHFQ